MILLPLFALELSSVAMLVVILNDLPVQVQRRTDFLPTPTIPRNIDPMPARFWVFAPTLGIEVGPFGGRVVVRVTVRVRIAPVLTVRTRRMVRTLV
jgi:hypothetical protein